MTIAVKDRDTGIQTQYGIQLWTKYTTHTHFGCKSLVDALAKAKDLQKEGRGRWTEFIIFSHHYRPATPTWDYPHPLWEKVDDNYTEMWDIEGNPITLAPETVLSHLWPDLMKNQDKPKETTTENAKTSKSSDIR